MQLSFKIDTFNPILIRSFAKCKHNKRNDLKWLLGSNLSHNKRCWPTEFFFPDENTLTSPPSSTVFFVFSFIFWLRNLVMCSRSRFWVTWRRQSRILSVWRCTKFSGVSTTGDRYNTPRTKELSHFPWSFWRYATCLKILLTHFRYKCLVLFAISDVFSTRAITYEDFITITFRIRGLFNLMEIPL